MRKRRPHFLTPRSECGQGEKAARRNRCGYLLLGCFEREKYVSLALIIKAERNGNEKRVIVGRPFADRRAAPRPNRPIVVRRGLEAFLERVFGCRKSLAIIDRFARLTRVEDFEDCEVVPRVRLGQRLPPKRRRKIRHYGRRVMTDLGFGRLDAAMRRARAADYQQREQQTCSGFHLSLRRRTLPNAQFLMRAGEIAQVEIFVRRRIRRLLEERRSHEVYEALKTFAVDRAVAADDPLREIIIYARPRIFERNARAAADQIGR